MRLVVVDVGNTSTAVGLWSDGRVSHVAHCDGGFGEASRVVESLTQTLKPSNPQTLTLAYVSVVPKVDRAWRTFAKAHGLAFRQVTYRCFATKKGEKIPFSNSNSTTPSLRLSARTVSQMPPVRCRAMARQFS